MKLNVDINGKGKMQDLEAHIEFECEAMEFVEMMKADKDTIQLIMSIFDKKMDQKREERHFRFQELQRENEALKKEVEDMRNAYDVGYEDGYAEAKKKK